MRRVELFEYRTTEAVPLNKGERDALRLAVPSMNVAPTWGLDDHYDLTPSSLVGTINLGTLGLEVRPKIGIARLLFLLSYSLDPAAWKDIPFSYSRADSLVEAVIPAFVAHANRALRPGVLQGYRREEDALRIVRGRIRLDDQVKRRFGRTPPIEVSFDEYTEDIDENRLLKAAIHRLRRLGPRSAPARQSLRSLNATLERVSEVRYTPSRLPPITFTRLNARYRAVVALAKLVLRSGSFEMGSENVRATTFLVDMNKAFEDFVTIALRDALRLSEGAFPQGVRGRSIALDEAGRLRLKPDLSWWWNGRCQFVGDVKYKRVDMTAARVLHPDVYQVLAYCLATDLPGGLLIYAKGEEEPATHTVRHVDRQIEVTALDLEGSPDEILEQVRNIGERITELRQRAATSPTAA